MPFRKLPRWICALVLGPICVSLIAMPVAAHVIPLVHSGIPLFPGDETDISPLAIAAAIDRAAADIAPAAVAAILGPVVEDLNAGLYRGCN